MDTIAIVVLIACAAVVLLGVVLFLFQRRHTKTLKDEFGTEYDRAVRSKGSSTKAERELDTRRKRVEALGIRKLSSEQVDAYSDRWRDVQARFVEEPQQAIEEADRLLNDVMMARGYPVGDFDRQVEDLSVEHGRIIAGYRKAHGIAAAPKAGVEPETEQVRQAILCYREVFSELLGKEPVARAS